MITNRLNEVVENGGFSPRPPAEKPGRRRRKNRVYSGTKGGKQIMDHLSRDLSEPGDINELGLGIVWVTVGGFLVECVSDDARNEEGKQRKDLAETKKCGSSGNLVLDSSASEIASSTDDKNSEMSQSHVTTDYDHVTSLNGHVTTEDHVTVLNGQDNVATDDGHMTTDDHVTSLNGHVTVLDKQGHITTDDHVTNSDGHVSTDDHVTELDRQSHVITDDDHEAKSNGHVTVLNGRSDTTINANGHVTDPNHVTTEMDHVSTSDGHVTILDEHQPELTCEPTDEIENGDINSSLGHQIEDKQQSNGSKDDTDGVLASHVINSTDDVINNSHDQKEDEPMHVSDSGSPSHVTSPLPNESQSTSLPNTEIPPASKSPDAHASDGLNETAHAQLVNDVINDYQNEVTDQPATPMLAISKNENEDDKKAGHLSDSDNDSVDSSLSSSSSDSELKALALASDSESIGNTEQNALEKNDDKGLSVCLFVCPLINKLVSCRISVL